MSRVIDSRYRWSIGSRVLAASVGGYAFVSLLAAAAALLLPMERFDAYLTATMSAFVVYAIVIMSVFRARSAARAWTWLAAASTPPCVVLLVFSQGSIR